MTDLIYPPCRKCGASHGMGLENMETGEIKPIDLCENCLFEGCRYSDIKNRLSMIDLKDFRKKDE